MEFKPNTDIQDMMVELGCTGDCVKPQDIVDRIEEIDFQTVVIAGNQFMYCGIRMMGGFVVVGKPATCIDPANWRDEIGKKVSFDNTFSEIYKLEAYRKMSKPKSAKSVDKAGFVQFEGKPVVRTAYQLTESDINSLLVVSDSKSLVWVEGEAVSFAFHCMPHEIKAGDYVVFLNDEDTYHCSEEVFNERNIV